MIRTETSQQATSKRQPADRTRADSPTLARQTPPGRPTGAFNQADSRPLPPAESPAGPLGMTGYETWAPSLGQSTENEAISA